MKKTTLTVRLLVKQYINGELNIRKNNDSKEQESDSNYSLSFLEEDEDIELNLFIDTSKDITKLQIPNAFVDKIIEEKESLPVNFEGKKAKRNYIDYLDNLIDNQYEMNPALNLQSKRFQPNLIENNIIWGIQNNQNSCRYDTFLTLLCLKLKFLGIRFSGKTKDSWFNKLLSVSKNFMNNKKQAVKCFWLCNFNNGFDMDKPGNFGAIISSLFSIFSCLEFCNLMVRDQRFCNNCGLDTKTSNFQKIGPLLSINGSSNESIGLIDRLKKYFSSYRSYCPYCIGGGTEALTVTRSVLSMPKYAFIVLDYSFEELCKFHDYQEFITLNHKNYLIFAAIIKPNSIHFALILKDPIDPVSAKASKGWFLYDDLLNEGNLTVLHERVKEILHKNNFYILLYEIYEQ